MICSIMQFIVERFVSWMRLQQSTSVSVDINVRLFERKCLIISVFFSLMNCLLAASLAHSRGLRINALMFCRNAKFSETAL